MTDHSSDSFELFKLGSLLDHASEDDAKIILGAIRHMRELERQVARDDELWRGMVITPQSTGAGQ